MFHQWYQGYSAPETKKEVINVLNVFHMYLAKYLILS